MVYPVMECDGMTDFLQIFVQCKNCLGQVYLPKESINIFTPFQHFSFWGLKVEKIQLFI